MRLPFYLEDLTISHWQIAIDGNWEDAKEIRVGGKEDIDNILNWVKDTFNDIVIEAFFGSKQDNFFFLGVRIKTLNINEKIKFLENCFSTAKTNHGLKGILEIMNISLNQKYNLMEIGAEGFWKSYGPYVVWTKGDKSIKSIDKIANDAPHILKHFKRPMILEFAWDFPFPIWIGVPISSKESNKEFKFNSERYKKLVKMDFYPI